MGRLFGEPRVRLEGNAAARARVVKTKEGRAMTKRKAEKKLHELLMELFRCRETLSNAKRDGDATTIERARRKLLLQHLRIRSHCTETGLERPYDVPEG